MAPPTVRQKQVKDHESRVRSDANPRSTRAKKTLAATEREPQPVLRNQKTAGPRTKMGSKNIVIRDLVLVAIPDVGDRLAEVTGGYMMGAVWMLQLGRPPGFSEKATGRLSQLPSHGHWLPAHVKANQVRVVYRRAVR